MEIFENGKDGIVNQMNLTNAFDRKRRSEAYDLMK